MIIGMMILRSIKNSLDCESNIMLYEKADIHKVVIGYLLELCVSS